jgi:hypothetical protein
MLLTSGALSLEKNLKLTRRKWTKEQQNLGGNDEMYSRPHDKKITIKEPLEIKPINWRKITIKEQLQIRPLPCKYNLKAMLSVSWPHKILKFII